MLQKFITLAKSYQYQIFLAICILLISFISFNLGKISSNEKGYLKVSEGANIYKAVAIENNNEDITATSKTIPKPLDLRVVVSKASDSRKYHHAWCGSWKKIKPENQLWFNSAEEAEKAGYTLAGNCTK